MNFAKFVRTSFFAEHHQTKLLTIFAKKVPSQMFDWVENRLQAKGLKY